jgi:hypothetical protein
LTGLLLFLWSLLELEPALLALLSLRALLWLLPPRLLLRWLGLLSHLLGLLGLLLGLLLEPLWLLLTQLALLWLLLELLR